jgi:putative transposase
MVLEGYKSNNNVVYSSKYHVVWTPKYKGFVLVGPVAKRCEKVIRETVDKYPAEIIALEIMADHFHLLCEVDPQLGIHRLVKNLKGVSSHALGQEFRVLKSRLPTLWTNRHLVSTVGEAPLAVIQQYVEHQKNV